MPSILQNVTALSASRQINITQMGLKQAIERLTTGKRINRASDDAAGMQTGNSAEATARESAAKVKSYQGDFFVAQAADAFLEEATQLAYRLAELEGSGNSSSAEYSAVQTLIGEAVTAGTTALGDLSGNVTGVTLGASATTAQATLTSIATDRTALAQTMAEAKTRGNIEGIRAENNFAISDTWLGADIGAEMVNLTKYQIMMQAGTSALSNANQSSQTVLGLFR